MVFSDFFMSQPTEYQRQYSFSAFQAASPDDPLPAVKIELELNAIKTTLDQIRTNLALIQRDDGELANSSVGTAQLEATLTTLGFDRPTSWLTATAYAVDAAVFEANKLYFCLVAHTSGTFATDLAAAKWTEVVDFTTLVTDAEDAADAAAVSAAAASASAASAAAVVAAALPLAGGTMLGPIVTSGDATLATQAPRLSQVQSGVSRHATSTGGTVDVITTVHSPVRTAWVTGMSGCFTASGANTIAGVTMNPDGIGAKTFLKNNLQALVAGDIAGAGHEVEWEYNGTNLIIKNPSSSNAYTVNGQTQETAPATGDFLGGYDLTATAERKFSIIDVLEVTNLLTEDTSPDLSADFALVYDSSANTVKKVKPTNLAPAASMTLLGTITTTSGTSATLGSLVLTAYKQLFLVVNGLSADADRTFLIGNSTSDDVTFTQTTGGAGFALTGTVTIDLGTGIGSSILNLNGSNTSAIAFDSALSTATTTISVAPSSSNLDAGEIKVYGVR